MAIYTTMMDFFAEMNMETGAVAQAHWLSLIQPFVVGASTQADGGIQVPLKQAEAGAMIRKYRRQLCQGDAELMLKLEQRIDQELAKHRCFESATGRACFCKLTDCSPKDLEKNFKLDRVQKIAERRILDEQKARGGLGWTTNAALQAVLWTKGQFLKCTSGSDVVQLLCSSERCMEAELERKGYPHNKAAMDKNPVHILLREWVDVDPAFELRGFVSHGNLRGLSQMASMDIAGVHYPQLLDLVSRVCNIKQEARYSGCNNNSPYLSQTRTHKQFEPS